MKLSSPIPAVLPTIFIAYLAIILLYAERFDYNFSGFVCIGARFAAPDSVPPRTLILPSSHGYDGQFYWYAARDPFIRGEAWRFMDVPSYRYGRILYPWLAALAALGKPDLLPWTLVLVNLAGVLMGSCLVVRWLEEREMSSWYAVFYGLLSGFILCLLRDLAGPVAMGFLVGGLYYLSRRRYLAGGLFLSAALLAREIFLIVPAVYLFFSFVARRSWKRITALSLAFLPFLLWRWYIYSRFRDIPWREGGGNLGEPFTGIVIYWQTLMGIPGRESEKIYLVIFLMVCAFSLVLAVREVIRSKDELSITFLIYSIFPVFMTTSIWVEPWSYGRVLLPGAVLLMVNFIRTRDRFYLVPLGGHLVLSGVILWWVGII